jgi:hypothetical protein
MFIDPDLDDTTMTRPRNLSSASIAEIDDAPAASPRRRR